jgi:hypothetical protein
VLALEAVHALKDFGAAQRIESVFADARGAILCLEVLCVRQSNFPLGVGSMKKTTAQSPDLRNLIRL